MTLWLQQGPQIPPVPEVPPIPEVVIHNSMWGGLPPWVVLALSLAALAATALILWPIARAIGRAIEARTDRRFGTAAEIERLQERVTELEAITPRLAELEERLDFAERVLTRPAAAQPLQAGDA
jgi:hypothetical protein